MLRLPEVAELGQPHERQVGTREHHHGDERDREPREPDESRPSQRGREGPERKASVVTPPTQIDAATRCSQSASSDSTDELGSVAWCPESDSPDARATETASAGHHNSSRSRFQPTSRSAATTPKPKVMTRKAIPSASSRSTLEIAYGRSAIGSWSAFDARSTKPAIPTSITRNAATTETT